MRGCSIGDNIKHMCWRMVIVVVYCADSRENTPIDGAEGRREYDLIYPLGKLRVNMERG